MESFAMEGNDRLKTNDLYVIGSYSMFSVISYGNAS